MTSTPLKRILVLRNNLAFNAGVQNLLSEQKILDVIGMEVSDRRELFQHVLHLQPDVIITDEGFLLPNLAALLKFLQSYPKKRTILMSLKANQIQVYDTKKIEVEELVDFLAVFGLSNSSDKNH